MRDNVKDMELSLRDAAFDAAEEPLREGVLRVSRWKSVFRGFGRAEDEQVGLRGAAAFWPTEGMHR